LIRRVAPLLVVALVAAVPALSAPAPAAAGTAVWDRYAATMTVSLDLPRGHLAGSWDTRTPGVEAVLSGRLDGRRVRISLLPP